MPALAAAPPANCASGPAAVATANAASESTLLLNLFGREETGWLFYVPLISNETGTDCPAESAGFAKALATWQSAHGLSGTGTVDTNTLQKLKEVWQAKRPFVQQSAHHQCPAPPNESTLAQATTAESYGGKQIHLRTEALAAYRDMVAAARKDGVLSSDQKLLQIFSAYRSPDYDAARCAVENNCTGVVRAVCSAHRTALAMDVYLGAAPGSTPDSSADINRLFISKSPAYRWLVKNAARFGFVNYPFEPWHWEFVGRPASR
ncbi:MAG TPA: D-alanyl-D-alanine carboxypeptidase family protein [Rhizomicrobium sp.]|jgi:LAS superfamily LD-carboxypeptidase LdcB|nr:D-alanyl-D-alanine carboxypeptidase family protein [Rhizomicrobium sp.]